MKEAVFLMTTGALYFFNYGFLNDNTDNIDNGKNGRNWGCHKVTYNTDNGITSLLLLLFVLSAKT